jgi:hypothetical protein
VNYPDWFWTGMAWMSLISKPTHNSQFFLLHGLYTINFCLISEETKGGGNENHLQIFPPPFRFGKKF